MVNVQVTIFILNLSVCKSNMHCVSKGLPVFEHFVATQADVWGNENAVLQIHSKCLQNENARVCLLNQEFAFSRCMQYHFINPHPGHDHRAQALLLQLTYADDALSMHPYPPHPLQAQVSVNAHSIITTPSSDFRCMKMLQVLLHSGCARTTLGFVHSPGLLW